MKILRYIFAIWSISLVIAGSIPHRALLEHRKL